MTITVKSGIPLPLIRGEHNQAMLAALQKLKKNQCLDVTQGTVEIAFRCAKALKVRVTTAKIDGGFRVWIIPPSHPKYQIKPRKHHDR